MKKISILTLIGLLTLSCSNDDNSTAPIIGEWKLTTAEYYGLNSNEEYELYTVDYSDKNIVYDFQTSGILIVSGEQNIGHENGEYEYHFGEGHLDGDDSGPETLLVKINDSKWTYSLTYGKMRLGKSYVDGPDLIFERK